MPRPVLHPIKLRWFFWTTAGLFLFVIIGFYSMQMARNYNTYDDQRAFARYDTLYKLQAAEQQALSTADWVDQGKKIVRIPIQEAMTEEIDVLKAKPVAMGTAIPVVGAAPAAPAPAAAAPAAATTNATPAPTSSNVAPAATSTNAKP